LALEIFYFQYNNNEVYKHYVGALRIDPHSIDSIETIPYLPISFFKTHKVVTTFFESEIIFESSGTTGENTSRHYVKSIELYQKSFLKGFKSFYGDISNWSILGLLPGYLERKNSSLVVMVDDLIKKSKNSDRKSVV
jgi:phenylacetate-coenzyme A ligase PaaK-like adenylate-forming protein